MAGNLWSGGSIYQGTDKIYKHSGGTSTITTSFSAPGDSLQGLTWDGTNLWSTDNSTDKIYKHSGGTSTITTSFAGPGSACYGLAWDGTNLWSCDLTSDKIYKHSGGTVTITTSFSSPASLPTGITWDGTNLWSCDYTAEKIYKHSGGTSTITTSFSTLITRVSGLTWSGQNLWSSYSVDVNKIYEHSGETSTIITSFSGQGTYVVALAWEWTAVAPTVTTQAATSIKHVIATGNGNITDNGFASITQHGVCWKLGSDPVDIAGSDGSTTEGAGVKGAFTSDMTGLTVSSTYYYRAYATNSVGTSYGAAQTFKTLMPRHAFINFQNPGIF